MSAYCSEATGDFNTMLGTNQHFDGKDATEVTTDHQKTTRISTPDTISDGPRSSTKVTNDAEPKPRYTWRFWAIIAALCVTGLLSAVEGTVPSTALPSIIDDLEGGNLYIWVVNAYFLTSTAFQPLFGQTANIFGRRWLMISAVALFTLGSGIAGGANGMPMLVGGRTVQGIGGGGINMMIELIICDLVPLRERGNILALLFAVVTVGTSLGPFVGGILVDRSTWRWVFYINLPIGGAALALLLAFLQVGYNKESTLREKLKRIDYIGNAIFMTSIVSILIALAFSGTVYPWSSWRIILPLILGFIGLPLFYLFERSRFCLEPTLPPQLFANRTSATAFILTFIHSILFMWAIYFLPIYFQACFGSSPARSGVMLLPTVLVLMPFAAISGAVLGKYGRYRLFHHIGFALMILGLGLFTLLDPQSSTARWVIFQIIFAAGAGFVVSTLLPAAQAELDEKDTATATGTWAFMRSFGIIWGVSIPAAVFNNQTSNLSSRIDDPTIRELLRGGNAYQYATGAFVNSLQGPVRDQVTEVYSGSLRVVWQVAIAFAAIGFLLVGFEKEIKLRTDLETEFGLVERDPTAGKDVERAPKVSD